MFGLLPFDDLLSALMVNTWSSAPRQEVETPCLTTVCRASTPGPPPAPLLTDAERQPLSRTDRRAIAACGGIGVGAFTAAVGAIRSYAPYGQRAGFPFALIGSRPAAPLAKRALSPPLRNASAPMSVAPLISPADAPIAVSASLGGRHDRRVRAELGREGGPCQGQGSGSNPNSPAGDGCNDDAHDQYPGLGRRPLSSTRLPHAMTPASPQAGHRQ
jgi:hypothetical protein